MLPKEAIRQFKELYLRHYKVELSDEEAFLRANNLFFLYEAIYGDRPGVIVKSESEDSQNIK